MSARLTNEGLAPVLDILAAPKPALDVVLGEIFGSALEGVNPSNSFKKYTNLIQNHYLLLRTAV